MQITQELKEKLDNAKTEEERSAILSEAKEKCKKAGIELEDAELDEADGGSLSRSPIPFSRKYSY